jgi:hypothetical protein
MTKLTKEEFMTMWMRDHKPRLSNIRTDVIAESYRKRRTIKPPRGRTRKSVIV